MDHFAALATAAAILVTALILRLVRVVRSIQKGRRGGAKKACNSTLPSNHQVKTMAILGSGGHTTEMLRLLEQLDPQRYSPVVYVVAESDATSIPRLQRYIGEDAKRKELWAGRILVEADEAKQSLQPFATVHRLSRAREVGQSYLTSVVTTLRSFLQTLVLVWRVRPQLILANGPGTCVPVIVAAFLFRILFGAFGGVFPSLQSFDCKVVFVESLCRVRTLSLSGRLVYHVADAFVVHWPGLKERYPIAELSDVFVRHDGANERETG
ncbi:hypothetical protein ACHAXT_008978 [Thalassiosira profunda]